MDADAFQKSGGFSILGVPLGISNQLLQVIVHMYMSGYLYAFGIFPGAKKKIVSQVELRGLLITVVIIIIVSLADCVLPHSLSLSVCINCDYFWCCRQKETLIS